MVLKLIALPPALLIPLVACAARSPRCILQGVKSLGDPATAICGFLKSSSVNPTARSIERAGARSSPSTTVEEWGRLFMSVMVISN